MGNKKLNHQWQRVTGDNLQPQHTERGKQNETIMNSPEFIANCRFANVEPTRRQASKYRRGLGLAARRK